MAVLTALPAYRRAAQLDPGEPWTWIAIAWMGEATPVAGPYKLWPQTAMTWMGEAADAEVKRRSTRAKRPPWHVAKMMQ